MVNRYRSYPHSLLWYPTGVFALILCVIIAYLYSYEKKLDDSTPRIEPAPTVVPAQNDLPQGQMEDGPALEDLPILEHVPLPQAATTDLIHVESLHAGDYVVSPLVVTGEARGNWFFEASFPINIVDENGTVIGMGYGQAQGEWMTENFVPWKATLSFIAPQAGGGEVVFKKDNPSGLPEHDAELHVPVLFAHPQ